MLYTAYIACIAYTEDGYRIEISDLESRGIVLQCIYAANKERRCSVDLCHCFGNCNKHVCSCHVSYANHRLSHEKVQFFLYLCEVKKNESVDKLEKLMCDCFLIPVVSEKSFLTLQTKNKFINSMSTSVVC